MTRGAWLALALAAALAAAFAALGRWQWHRADEARALRAEFAAAAELPPLDRAPPDDEASALRYRKVALRGRYEPKLQFLLDNRVRDGKAGYEVVTPFRIEDVERRLLVNRGWVAADLDRSRLPDVTVDAAEREIGGRIDVLPRAGLDLDEAAPTPNAAGVAVVSYPTAAELGAALGRAVFGYQLLLDPDMADGFARDWQVSGPPPDRHLAYAGQWWLLALTALVIGGLTARKLRRGAQP